MQQPAPKPYIEVGPVAITTGQYFSITLHSPEKAISSYGPFPEIKGFTKQRISTRTSIQFTPKGRELKHSLTQYYVPRRAGNYVMPTLALRVNGVLARHAGVRINVRELPKTPHKPSFAQSTSPFDQIYSLLSPSPPEDEAFVEVEDEAFFALSVNKKEVFVGEPFRLTLAFYVSYENRAYMEFYDLENQLTDIINRVTPKNCWEENLRLSLPAPEHVNLGKKSYKRRILYQSVFYPLEDSPIEFPAVGLKMVKPKVSKTPTFWGRRSQRDYKTFYTRARKLKVKPLPPHPLRDQVSVGQFFLVESPKGITPIATGQGTDYQLTIRGEGNISAMPNAFMYPQKGIEVYPPRITQEVERGNGRVVGEKSFVYHIIAQAPGKYPLAKQLLWVYFDPKRVRYDTLRPSYTLDAQGLPQSNLHVASNNKDPFYVKAFQTTTPSSSIGAVLTSVLENKYLLRLVFIAGTVLGLGVLFFKKRT